MEEEDRLCICADVSSDHSASGYCHGPNCHPTDPKEEDRPNPKHIYTPMIGGRENLRTSSHS